MSCDNNVSLYDMSCDNNVSVYEELFTIFLRRGLIANSSAMLLDESRSIVFTGIPRQLYMEGGRERVSFQQPTLK